MVSTDRGLTHQGGLFCDDLNFDSIRALHTHKPFGLKPDRRLLIMEPLCSRRDMPRLRAYIAVLLRSVQYHNQVQAQAMDPLSLPVQPPTSNHQPPNIYDPPGPPFSPRAVIHTFPLLTVQVGFHGAIVYADDHEALELFKNKEVRLTFGRGRESYG